MYLRRRPRARRIKPKDAFQRQSVRVKQLLHGVQLVEGRLVESGRQLKEVVQALDVEVPEALGRSVAAQLFDAAKSR